MKNITETVNYVKEQISFYKERVADPKTKNPKFFQYHLSWHEDILSHLENHNAAKADISATSKDYILIKPEDIKDLPKEVLAELSLAPSDYAEFDIVNLIKKHGGVMSLDHIIMATYRETGELLKRKMITARLYRMIGKGLLYSVRDKRATYTTDPTLGDSNPEPQQEELINV